jgi:hypothetical protein
MEKISNYWYHIETLSENLKAGHGQLSLILPRSRTGTR